MQCPSCPTFMSRLAVGHIELDECPRCLGMWFDEGELQRILFAELANRNLQQRFVPRGEVTLPTRASCPRCIVSSLHERDVHGHPVASCTGCGGLWVPAPVLATLLAAGPIVATEPSAHEAPPAAATPALTAPLLSYGCPACGGDLLDAAHQGQRFFECGACRGLYFERGGLPAFLGRRPETWPEPPSGGPEPAAEAPCAACGHPMDAINWQGRGARVFACQHCWGTFVSGPTVRRLVNPRSFSEPPIDASALFIWRVFDLFTDWVTRSRR